VGRRGGITNNLSEIERRRGDSWYFGGWRERGKSEDEKKP
jgi:hypothetical protein